MSAFEELGVMPEIIQALEDMDWQLPTPVQTEVVPLILGGGDVATAAETGSGKTGSFCIPILQTVFETRRTKLSASLLSSNASDGGGSTEGVSLSMVDRGQQVAIDSENCVAQCRHPTAWQGVRATRGVARGKWYFLARADDDGLLRIGWGSKYATLNLGTDYRGFGFGGTGMKSNNGKFDPYGESYTKGDQICCMIEFCDDSINPGVRISYMKNGKDLGVAFDVSVSSIGLSNICLFPTCTMKNAQVSVDFNSRLSELEARGFRPIGLALVEDGSPTDDVVNLLKQLASNKKKNKFSDSAVQTSSRRPLVIILEPSRELAGQVEEELRKIGKYMEDDCVRHLVLVGGGNPKHESGMLSKGVDVVTGTLGTIQMHLKKGSLSLDDVKFFVLDEADTFATDNLRDVLSIHEKIPARNKVQTLLFSATLHSSEIKNLSEKIQSFPTWIDLKGKEIVPQTVHHTLVRLDADADAAVLKEVDGEIKWPLDDVHKSLGENDAKCTSGYKDLSDAADIRSLTMKKLKLATLRKVIDANDMQHAMLFVRTQKDADNLESFLLQCSRVQPGEVDKQRFRGRRNTGPEVEYSCAVLHGGRRQQERSEALAAFKAGEVRFLVCTDVAARGIDVVGLPFLVNVTLPDKPENYIHRVGRVGRAERFGLAVSLVSAQKEAVWFHTCGKPKSGVCNRRKLVDAGGCVIWYNESKILGEIETRLKGQIEELGTNYRRQNESAEPIAYGARKGEEIYNAQTAAHINALRPAVKELMILEFQAQESFFGLQERYPL